MADKGTRWGDGKSFPTATTDEGSTTAEVGHSRNYVWNSVSLAWERMTQPGGSSGGGGAVTVADGADVAQGATTDASSANTVVGILKAIKAAITGTLTVGTHAVTDGGGSLTVDGTVTVANPTTNPETGLAKDATLTGGTLVSQSRGKLWNGAAWIDAPGDAVNGAKVQSAQLPAALVGGRLSVDASGVAVPITDNAGSITVDGTFFQATQPVSVAAVVHVDDNAGSLTVDAPVGTPAFVRMSDGAAALIGQKAMAASLPIVVASDQSAVPTKETPSTLVGTTISAANAGVTLTLALVASQFHYITSIEIVALNPTTTAIAAAATNLAFTSTNLGGIAWNAGTLLAAGAEKLIARMAFAQPLKSTTVATNSTIVAPAIGTGGLVRITVTYYTAT